MQEPLVYVVPIESILGKLSVVQAGDTGTIPFEHIASTPEDVEDLCELFYPGGRADSAAGKCDGTRLWHTNAWAMGQVVAAGPRICPGFSSESLSGPPKSPVIGEL